MKSKKLLLIPLLLAGLLPLSPLLAQDAPTFAAVPIPLTREAVAGYLQNMGYAPLPAEGSDKQLTFSLDKYSCHIVVNKSDIQVYAWFNGPVEVAAINRFNEAYRFCDAYVDDEADVCIETDLDFEGGISMDAFKIFLDTYLQILNAYASFDPDSK